MQFRRCQHEIPCWNRAKKGYFSTFSRRWGRENTLRAAIAQRGGWRRPIYVPGAERGAAGASRGRAGAERRKSPFLGRVGTTRAWIKLYSISRSAVLCLCDCLKESTRYGTRIQSPPSHSTFLYVHSKNLFLCTVALLYSTQFKLCMIELEQTF